MRHFVFVLGCLAVSTLSAPAADWPQWRGPNRDGISADKGLLEVWPAAGPKLRWTAKDIGTGYSSPSIVGGNVFVQTTKGNDEFCLCLNEKTGQELWLAKIGLVGKNRGPQYPGTRATPTIDGKYAYCLASDGTVACLSIADGKPLWTKQIAQDFGGEVGMWAYTESLLVDGDAVICTPGGATATLAALNKLTGEVIWKSAVPGGDIADYASIMAVTVDGKKEYVQFLRKGLVGVDAKTGKFLWKYARTVDQGANILTPVVMGTKIFSSGSRTGGSVVEVTATGETASIKELFFDKAIAPSIGGAVLVDGYLYGTTSSTMFCVDFATGKVKWTERSVAPASICYADGRLYVRGYNGAGEVALVEPSGDAYKELSRFKPANRSKIQAWPHPVIANAGLYLRDQDALLCYEIGK